MKSPSLTLRCRSTTDVGQRSLQSERREQDAADLRLLQCTEFAQIRAKGRLRIVDLFSGCGGMTLGAALAARDVGLELESVLSVDNDPVAAKVHKENFQGGETVTGTVESLFQGNICDKIDREELKWQRRCGKINLLVGGPPCQGNSNLNNHTRRDDERNVLYLRMARAAEVLRPKLVIIENVPSVVHDRGGIVLHTTSALKNLGYKVGEHTVSMTRYGVPQRRKRHVLVGSRLADSDEEVLHRLMNSGSAELFMEPRTAWWAIQDLAKLRKPTAILDIPSEPSEANRERIQWLFDNDEYRLPDDLRPRCHREGGHSYKTVYGRMDPNRPSQTITTGFNSPGRGCYIHPKRPTTITPHEAARLQTFPDFFKFGQAGTRRALAKVIGNAVPPLFMRGLVKDFLDLT